MRKIILMLFILSNFLWISPVLAERTGDEYFVPVGDYIGNLDIEAKLNSDTSLLVKESEEWVFATSSEPLEIVRQWPLSFEGRNVEINKVSVSEVNGYTQASSKIDFKLEKKDGFTKVRITTKPRKKGEAQKYVLEYEVKGALYNLDQKNNHLRWWLWDYDFSNQVQNSKITVKLPQETDYSPLNLACLSGALGTNRLCWEGIHRSGAEGLVDKLVFREYNLNAHEGVLVEFNLPREIADTHLWLVKTKNWLISNLMIITGIFLSLALVAFLIIRRRKKV